MNPAMSTRIVNSGRQIDSKSLSKFGRPAHIILQNFNNKFIIKNSRKCIKGKNNVKCSIITVFNNF